MIETSSFHSAIGRTEFVTKKLYLTTLAAAGADGVETKLINPRASVNIRVYALPSYCHPRDEIKFECSGKDLDKKDTFGKSDPFFMIGRVLPRGERATAYLSEMIPNTLNPVWRKFEVYAAALCGGDHDANLFVEVYDYDAGSDADIIGVGYFTLRQIITVALAGSVAEIPLTNPKTKKGSGRFLFNSVQYKGFFPPGMRPAHAGSAGGAFAAPAHH